MTITVAVFAAECTRRIVAIEGAVKAICSRLLTVDPYNRTSRDLAEQCIKVSCHNKNQSWLTVP